MYQLIKKALFFFPPELAHKMALGSLAVADKLGVLSILRPRVTHDVVKLMHLEFPNRIGLAAGLDKNGEYIKPLAHLGFGFIEIGTVTPRPQPGNPQPRLFRLPKANAIINRMGFNNKGIDYLLEQVDAARNAGFDGIIGINIGKNFDTPVERATDDYLIGLRKAYPYASYITVNISSPNTPGLRDLQYGKELNELLSVLKAEQMKLLNEYQVYKAIAIKVAPDLDDEQIEGIAEALLDNQMDALIATNTTLSRDGVENLPGGNESGGLSGRPLKQRSTEVIRKFHTLLGDRLPIIGVGGIESVDDVEEKLAAGASLVQIYSGLIYEGPGLIKHCLNYQEPASS